MTDTLTYIDPLPPAHGQRAANARRAIARMRAAAAWEAHQMGVAVNREALLSIQMENREARLRPEYREDYHLERGRLKPVTIRREFPYGPFVQKIGQPKSLFVRMKAAILTLLTLKVVARVFGKESSWLDDVTKVRPQHDHARHMHRGNYTTRRFIRRGGQRGA